MTEVVNTNSTLVNEIETDRGPLSGVEREKIVFWGVSIIYLFIALIAVVGNVLVLYVSLSNRNHGPLKHLDSVIQSLAVADMLFGLIGMPCRIIGTNIVTRGVYKINFDFDE